jgi:signal transduction histidine kinase
VLLAGSTLAAAVAAALGWALALEWLAAGGLVAATALGGAFAVYLIVSERRRHEVAEDTLQAQASFLETLVTAIAAVSRTRDPAEILEQTCAEAQRLFSAGSARFVENGAAASEPTVHDGHMVLPVAVRGESIGAIELDRPEPFHRSDAIAASVLVDFAARAVENARLVSEAQEREAERARLGEHLISAEQDERRRLSLFLHDGPLQSMSGIALMHDAALAALRDGRHADAEKVIETSLDREREVIRTLRDLSFALEPLVLRDQGFPAAVRALRDQIEQAHRISVSVDVDAGERLGEKGQAALYQIIREALGQAVMRKPARVEVTVAEHPEGGVAAEISDDGLGERRRASIEAIEERVRVLNGRLSVELMDGGGTRVRVILPPYVAAATD